MFWIVLLLGCPVVTEDDQANIRDRDDDGFDAISFGGLDCDDTDPDIHPLAAEVYYDGVDDDCDPTNDDDQDGDGVPVETDCDDTTEAYDDTLVERFFDGDGDGYGTAPDMVCPNAEGWAERDGDCDDSDGDVNPGATEVWYDGVDDDCDGNDDDRDGDRVPFGVDCDDDDPDVKATRTWFRDLDEDGFGDPSAPIDGGCEPDPFEVGNDLDCNDARADVNPNAPEVCDADGVDEDCDGLVDDADDAPGNQSYWYVDADGDGFGVGAGELMCDGSARSMVQVDGDCDDDDDEEKPDAVWTFDFDGDGYGALDADGIQQCERIPRHASVGGDCDDRESTINPGEVDAPFDFFDSDCGFDTDTDTDTDADAYPDPRNLWDDDPDTTCPPLTVRHAGLGHPYADATDALQSAPACTTVVLHEGTYASFEVDVESAVITAAPGEEVVIQAVFDSAIRVQADNVTLSGLDVRDGFTNGIFASAGTYIERTTVTGTLLGAGVVGAPGMVLFGVVVEDNPVALDHRSGPMQAHDTTFRDSAAVVAVYVSTTGPVLFRNVDFDDLRSLFGSVEISSDELELRNVTMRNLGNVVTLRGDDVLVSNLDIVDSVVPGTSLLAIEPRNVEVEGTSARVTGVTLADNLWSPPGGIFFGPGVFFAVNDFTTTVIDKVSIRNNLLDGPDAPPVWLQSLGPSFLLQQPELARVIQHVEVHMDDALDPEHRGVGIQSQAGVIRQATVVGLDTALWTFPGRNQGEPLGSSTPPAVLSSILWDNDELVDEVTEWDGQAPARPTPVLDVATDDVAGCPICLHAEPAFLRYDPALPAALWDLQLLRFSPYYRLDDPNQDATCSIAAFFGQDPASQATELQLGAFGDHALEADDPLKAPEALSNDCDGDGLYDRWEREWSSYDPLEDVDADGYDTLEEHDAGTLPIFPDTDGDGANDSADAFPLDPTR